MDGCEHTPFSQQRGTVLNLFCEARSGIEPSEILHHPPHFPKAASRETEQVVVSQRRHGWS